MLQLSNSLINRPILSLRTGGEVATTTVPIINPNNLKVEGIYCTDRFNGELLVLLPQDIREQLAEGFVVNDHEVLVEPADLVRLKKVLKIQFELIDKRVYTDTKTRLGKIDDYAVDGTSLYIQKLYVAQSVFKSLTTGQLSIDRNQIIEITDRKIIVKDPLKPINASAAPLVA